MNRSTNVVLVFLLSFVCCAYSMDESFALIKKVDRMHRPNAQHGGEKQYKLDRVLHLPLRSKNNDNYDIAHAMSAIDMGEVKNKKTMQHIDSSVLWQFARLPFELQHKVVDMMLDYNKKATAIFLQTPFLYALNRHTHVRQIGLNHSEFSDKKVSEIFLKIWPYVEKRIVADVSLSTDHKSAICLSSTGGCVISGAATWLPLFLSPPVSISTSLLPVITLVAACGGSILGGMFCSGYYFCTEFSPEVREELKYKLL